MLERFAHILEEQDILSPNSTYIVAVSGGVDSMVLLDLLSRLAGSWGWTLIVAHLDHAQRPGSEEIAMRVGAITDRYGHRFVTNRLRAERLNESAMRDRRYAWLREMRNAYDAAAIITAHHANDRLETAMWHAIRGSGRHGLTSLRQGHEDLIRPLIRFRRGDILLYAHQQDLDWDEDPSNADTDFTRNVIRHELLGNAPIWDPHYHQNLTDWLDHLQNINQRVDTMLERLLEQVAEPVQGGYVLQLPLLRQFSSPVLTELLAYAARSIRAGKGFTRSNLHTAETWVRTAPTGSFTEALPGLIITREYDRVNFVVRTAPLDIELADGNLPLVAQKPVTMGRFTLHMMPSHQADDEAYHLASGEYYVRRWQAGDRVQPLGMSGTKKVQDVFVDNKVPRRDRMIWPLVVSGSNDIALIPGLVRDRRFAATPDDQSVAVAVKGV